MTIGNINFIQHVFFPKSFFFIVYSRFVLYLHQTQYESFTMVMNKTACPASEADSLIICSAVAMNDEALCRKLCLLCKTISSINTNSIEFSVQLKSQKNTGRVGSLHRLRVSSHLCSSMNSQLSARCTACNGGGGGQQGARCF